MAEDEEPYSDETVALTRRARRRAASSIAEAGIRPEPVRSPEPENTPKPEDSPDAEDETVVVDRAVPRTQRVEDGGSASVIRPLTVAPTNEATATPSIYKPRPAPLIPASPPAIAGAAAPTRIEDPDRPSVARQSRRWSFYAVAAAAAACVVSLIGLAVLAIVVFTG